MVNITVCDFHGTEFDLYSNDERALNQRYCVRCYDNEHNEVQQILCQGDLTLLAVRARYPNNTVHNIRDINMYPRTPAFLAILQAFAKATAALERQENAERRQHIAALN